MRNSTYVACSCHSKSVHLLYFWTSLCLLNRRLLIIWFLRLLFSSNWHRTSRYKSRVVGPSTANIWLAFEIMTFDGLSKKTWALLHVLVVVDIKHLSILVDNYRLEIDLLRLLGMSLCHHSHLVLKTHDFNVSNRLLLLHTFIRVLRMVASNVTRLALVLTLVTCILSIRVNLTIYLFRNLRGIKFWQFRIPIILKNELTFSCRFGLVELNLYLLLLKLHHVLFLNFLLDLFKS
jgi:hypothetical protein